MLRRIMIGMCIALLSACGREQLDDCFTSMGPIRTQERYVGEFHSVEIEDRIDLVLEPRTLGTVSVKAGQNLHGQVITEVSDGRLRIRNDNTCNWVRDLKARITVRVPVDGIGFILANGTGDITSTATISRSVFRLEQRQGQGSTRLDLDVDTCFAGMHTGAGSVAYTGRADVAFLYSGSMAPIDATALDASRVHINNSGVTDIRCRATDFLDAQIFDVGDIYYSGDPMIVSTLLGSGSLIKLD